MIIIIIGKTTRCWHDVNSLSKEYKVFWASFDSFNFLGDIWNGFGECIKERCTFWVND